MTPLIVLAGVGVIALSGGVIFAVLVIGIRREDRRYLRGRRHLVNAPRSNSEVLARRILSGSRSPEPRAQSAEKKWPRL